MIVSRLLGEPWMRQLDLWFGDGDRRRLALAMVAWSWLLVVPVLLGRWAVARFGKPGRVAWALLVLAVLPALGFSAGRSSGSDAAEELALDAVGDSAAGEVGAVIALFTMLAVVFLLVTLLVDTPLRRTGGDGVEKRGLVRPLVTWTAFWALVAVLMATTVDSYPTRGSWMATTAAEIAGGDDGVTGSYEVGLQTTRAEVLSCDEAAALLRVDGEQPELPGCRTAMVVEAAGRAGEGAERGSTGALAAVVLQTRTEGQLDRLDADLDDAELDDALTAGIDDPLGTLVTPARTAYALVLAAEDPGTAPLGEGSAQRPLTRALAYALIGTASGFYLAPPPADEG